MGPRWPRSGATSKVEVGASSVERWRCSARRAGGGPASRGLPTVFLGEDVSNHVPLSARNQLTGTVESVERSEIVAEVTVELGDGQTVTSTITSASVDRLGIEEGDEVRAVVKATEVMVSTD